MSVYGGGFDRRKRTAGQPVFHNGVGNGDRPTAEKCHDTAKSSSDIGHPADLLKKLDRDQLLIAALMLLIWKEGGDRRLLLALGYIIMG